MGRATGHLTDRGGAAPAEGVIQGRVPGPEPRGDSLPRARDSPARVAPRVFAMRTAELTQPQITTETWGLYSLSGYRTGAPRPVVVAAYDGNVSIRCHEIGTAECHLIIAKARINMFLFAVARGDSGRHWYTLDAGKTGPHFYSLSRDEDSGTFLGRVVVRRHPRFYSLSRDGDSGTGPYAGRYVSSS